MAQPLIDNVSADTTSKTVSTGANGLRRDSNFVITYFQWASSWGTATTKLQISPNGVDWFDVADTVSLTGTGAVNVNVGGGVSLRAVAVAGTGTGINVAISD